MLSGVKSFFVGRVSGFPFFLKTLEGFVHANVILFFREKRETLFFTLRSR